MAMTFNTIYSQVQSLTGDASAGSTTLFKNLVNQTQNNLLALRKDITETSKTDTTVANQQNYYLPYNYGKMYAITITVGSIAYPLIPIEDDTIWFQINARSSSYQSTIPSNYWIFNDQVYIYPKPSASGNTITMYYHKVVKPMTQDDYTTGTITTLTNGASSVTGSGTTWTAGFVGRSLNITSDGYWYEILTRASNTSVTLKKTFQGTSISAGSEAYTIGEMPTIPEAYHELMVWRPTALYWQQKKEMDKADFYWKLYNQMEKRFIEDRASKVESAIINPQLQEMRRTQMWVDPNSFPINLTS